MSNLTPETPNHHRALFERVTSLAMLRRGFEKVRHNSGAAGGDGMPVRVFEFGLDIRLRTLFLKLRNGTYMPGAVRAVDIAKNGQKGTRRLHIPSVVDRVAQTAAHFVLRDILEPEFEAHSYAYRPGRSVNMALDAVRAFHAEGYEWVVDADIKAYFENVPHSGVLSALAEHVAESDFLALVRLWLETSPHPGLGLPQGAPISPILANLYLDSLDEAVAGAGFRIVRYADDFVVLCKSRKRAEIALARLAEILAQKGLELHPEKTAIRLVDEGYRFLGSTIKGTSLGRQVAALGEPGANDGDPGNLPDELEADAPLEGQLEGTISRRISGREVTPHQDFSQGATALARPWKKIATYLSEGDEGADPQQPEEVEGERTKSRHAPFIRPLYLREKGRMIEPHQSGFAIVQDGEPIALLHPGSFERIDIFPGAGISTDGLRHAAAAEIPVNLVDGRGTTLSVCAPDQRRRAKLHLAQARHILDETLALALARQFVAGRIFNARALLQRLRLRLAKEAREEKASLARAIEKLGQHHARAERYPRYSSINQLHDEEAAAARVYWPALADLVKRGFGETKFTRSRLPPQSAFNAVLNFTAHLLRRDIETLLLRRGVHTGMGVLHTVNDTRSGCVFDLMEEFRAPVAEALANVVLSTGQLGPANFETFAVDGTEGVRIIEGGITRIIRAYERHVDHTVSIPASGEKTNWRGAMDHQVTCYIKHVLDLEPYRPHEMDF